MKKIKDVNYMESIPISGDMIYDKDMSEKIKEDYKKKNLNEAIDRAYKTLSTMSDQEFEDALKNSIDAGDLAKI